MFRIHKLGSNFFFHLSYYVEDTNNYVVMNYKGQEAVYVDSVRICGSDSPLSTGINKICITFRIPVRMIGAQKFNIFFLVIFLNFTFSVIRKLETNLQVVLARKAFAVSNVSARTCRSPRAASCRTLSSTRTASLLE